VQEEPPNASLLRTHGRLMIIAFACVLPFGVIFGRAVQMRPLHHSSLPARDVTRSRAVLVMHALLQTAGLALVAVSFALVVHRLNDGIKDIHRISLHHGDVGIAAVAFLFAQWLAGAILRPHQGTTFRRLAWEHAHAALGRCAIVLGVVNIFVGITIARDFHVITQTSYNVWVGLSAASLGFFWIVGEAVVKASIRAGSSGGGSRGP
jgi:Eukaryotic cytochrome b561